MIAGFTIAKSINRKDLYIILLNEQIHEYINTQIKTSYGILLPRLFGLTYAEFLQFVRDKYGAQLIDSGSKYINFGFVAEKDAIAFVREANRRWFYFYQH